MKAGRELDAVIAEKLMGWKWHPVTLEKTFYGAETISLGGFWLDERVCSVMNTNSDGTPNCPHYSTDLYAAWAVGATLRRKGYSFEVRATPYDTYYIYFGEEMSAEAPTVSEAICLAAMKVIEAESRHGI